MSGNACFEKRLVSLKVLYTLHGVASQKFVVKPVDQVEARVFEEADLGIVALQPCLEAIRHSSPDYAEICDSSANDYAIYSVDYAEDGLPLQGHGRVSEHVLREVTGKLKSSKLLREQLELQIHLLPIRVPQDMPHETSPADQLDHSQSKGLASSLPQNQGQEHRTSSTLHDDESSHKYSPGSSLMYPFPNVPPPPASLGFDMHFPPMPSLPESLHGLKSDSFLPSSPPVRARPTKIAPSAAGTVAPRRVNPVGDMTPAKRSVSESTYPGPKKKKLASPGSSSEASSCGNCGVESASTWRRVKVDGPSGSDILLCNACGLYYKTKNVMRPAFLWDRTNRLATRAQEPQLKPPSSKTSSNRRNSPVPAEPTAGPGSVGSGSADSGPQAASDTFSQDAATDASSPDMPLPSSASKPPQRQVSGLSHTGSDTRRTELDDLAEAQVSESQHPLQLHLPEPPSTPPRSSSQLSEAEQVPSSIERLFLVTPDGKKTINIHLPGSGSAGKWLNRMMNSAEDSSYFESFLASPTPKKNPGSSRRHSDSPICSSPPTSSTLFSEIPDWNLFPTSPTPPKHSNTERSRTEEAKAEHHTHIGSTSEAI